MTGKATFSGTTYQAKVMAVVYTHILAERRLGWLGNLHNDVPISIAGETGGPGDDARVTLIEGEPSFEIQAKRGLSGGQALEETIQRVAEHWELGIKVVIAVNRHSKTVHQDFANDLEKIRSRRLDSLKDVTAKLLQNDLITETVLSNIYVVPLDLNQSHESDLKQSIDLLRFILKEPSDARAAWGTLVNDAGEISAKGLARTRTELSRLLIGQGFDVQELPPTQRVLDRLDHAENLLKTYYLDAAAHILDALKPKLSLPKVGLAAKYAYHRIKAKLHFLRGQFSDASNHARRATDYDPSGVGALILASAAEENCRNYTEAKSLAKRATEVDPASGAAWAFFERASHRLQENSLDVPAEVLSSPEFIFHKVQVAKEQEEWSTVKELTNSLGLFDDYPEVALARVYALINLAKSPREADLRQCIRLCTIVEDRLQGCVHHPILGEALAIRAFAHEELGNSEEAENDRTQALSIAPTSVSVNLLAARSALSKEDFDQAISILTNPGADITAEALLLRASAQVAQGHLKTASQTLKEYYALRDEEDEADSIDNLMMLSEVLVELGKVEDAQSIIRQIERGEPNKKILDHLPLIKARLAFEKGDTEAGQRFYLEAEQSAAEEMKRKIRLEASSRLGECKEFRQSAELLKELPFESLEPGELRFTSLTFLRARRLKLAEKTLRIAWQLDPIPEWAFQIGHRLAILSDDPDSAIAALSELSARDGYSEKANLLLANLYYELDRLDEAMVAAGKIDFQPSVDPYFRFAFAELQARLGSYRKATAIAHQAFRASRGEPEAHRRFISLVAQIPEKLKDPTVTGSETWVTLTNAEGDLRHYVIVDGDNPDRLRNELSSEDAGRLGLVGLQVGDEAPMDQSSAVAEQWTVTNIRHAFTRDFQDSIQHFEERFPEQPFFLKRFTFDSSDPEELIKPILASLVQQKARVQKLFQLYEANLLPLGALASVFGASVPEAMGQANQSIGRVLTEWPHGESRKASIMAAGQQAPMVLTRSALETAHALKILQSLEGPIVAPRSLEMELREELRRIAHQELSGQGHVIKQGDSVTFATEAELRPIRERRREEYKEMLEWLTSAAEIRSRPLESIDLDSEENRHTLGNTSYDALQIANQGARLYADDLGLRRCLNSTARSRSFSTIALLENKDFKATVGFEQASKLKRKLVELGHWRIEPDLELLMDSLRQDHSQIRVQCFALLSDMLVLGDAADLLVQTAKAVALDTILPVSTAEVVRLGLLSVRSSFPLRAFVTVTIRLAEVEFEYLLPHHLREIKTTCQQALQGIWSVSY